QSASQTVVVFAPGRNIAVKELPKRQASPRTCMYTIRDRLDRHFGKHLPRSFTVLFSDSIDVSTHAQRELHHVHGSALACSLLQSKYILVRLQNSFHQAGSGSIS